MFKECLANGIVPFIISNELELFYSRGLQEWNQASEYLLDTCLTAQDQYYAPPFVHRPRPVCDSPWPAFWCRLQLPSWSALLCLISSLSFLLLTFLFVCIIELLYFVAPHKTLIPPSIYPNGFGKNWLRQMNLWVLKRKRPKQFLTKPIWVKAENCTSEAKTIQRSDFQLLFQHQAYQRFA
jgi:hypothetical protein